MNEVEKPSSYSASHRKYYLENKNKILERCKASGLYERKYKSAYERNKDAIKAKALARYYAKKAHSESPSTSENESEPVSLPV
jgi:hypothetical protein